MKKILNVYTGGTICSAFDGEKRDLDPILAKRVLLRNFSTGSSPYADISSELFEDSGLEEEYQTLSENMTVRKLERIVRHIRSFDFEKYSGIIIMHGTDTLAFTAALFSFMFCNTPVPIMLVSGNRPPMDELSNANANFQTAVELIMEGIAPNVYVPYRNSDNIMWLHLGSTIMQCGNFSEDFFSASHEKSFIVDKSDNSYKIMLEKCRECSLKRKYIEGADGLSDDVILIKPYTGLDYSHISLEGVKAVAHGTYHSGTVCVGRSRAEEDHSTRSILYFAEKCQENNVPLIIAPCKLGPDQYASAFDLNNHSSVMLLNMTTEAAYGKLLTGVSMGLEAEELKQFMACEINNEMMD